MGQYHIIVNLTKREILHPHKFNDGLKLLEFGCSPVGAMTALAVLLADSNGRGGGDLRSSDPIVGSWAGDQIVVTGDYGDEGKWITTDDGLHWKDNQRVPVGVEPSTPNLYCYAGEYYRDISAEVLTALCEDSYIRERFGQDYAEHISQGYDSPFRENRTGPSTASGEDRPEAGGSASLRRPLLWRQRGRLRLQLQALQARAAAEASGSGQCRGPGRLRAEELASVIHNPGPRRRHAADPREAS